MGYSYSILGVKGDLPSNVGSLLLDLTVHVGSMPFYCIFHRFC